MRLFIAIELPHEVKQFLSEINSEIRKIPGVKTVSKENMHLTLLFLGQRNNSKEISDVLSIIQFKKFKLNLSDIGFFPDEKNIKVAWIGIEFSKDLMALQKQVAIMFENYEKYVPHLTFARIKRLSSNQRKEFLRILNKYKNRKFTFEVNKFKLYNSELTKLGPIHRVVEVFQSIN